MLQALFLQACTGSFRSDAAWRPLPGAQMESFCPGAMHIENGQCSQLCDRFYRDDTDGTSWDEKQTRSTYTGQSKYSRKHKYRKHHILMHGQNPIVTREPVRDRSSEGRAHEGEHVSVTRITLNRMPQHVKRSITQSNLLHECREALQRCSLNSQLDCGRSKLHR